MTQHICKARRTIRHTVVPDGKTNSDQTYSCPRDSHSLGNHVYLNKDTLWNPSDHRNTILLRGLRQCPELGPHLLPRNANLPESLSHFFQSGCHTGWGKSYPWNEMQKLVITIMLNWHISIGTLINRTQVVTFSKVLEKCVKSLRISRLKLCHFWCEILHSVGQQFRCNICWHQSILQCVKFHITLHMYWRQEILFPIM